MRTWDHGEPPVRDESADLEVRSSRRSFTGLVWDVRTDEVALPHGQVVTRDLVQHYGAVGVIALDEQDRVLLIRQYRHAVGSYLWEPPAGLLDLPSEPPLLAAQRELAEEAGLSANQWWVLADWFNSPGGSSESFRCYLARGLEPIHGGRPVGDGEEFDLPARWVPMDDVVGGVLAGELNNPTTVTGILAAAASRAQGWKGLRPPDAPWPAREHLVATDRVRRKDSSAG